MSCRWGLRTDHAVRARHFCTKQDCYRRETNTGCTTFSVCTLLLHRRCKKFNSHLPVGQTDLHLCHRSKQCPKHPTSKGVTPLTFQNQLHVKHSTQCLTSKAKFQQVIRYGSKVKQIVHFEIGHLEVWEATEKNCWHGNLRPHLTTCHF